jgi:hypothetical protein
MRAGFFFGCVMTKEQFEQYKAEQIAALLAWEAKRNGR